LGKLYETIFSLGGTASAGTDVDFAGTDGDGSRGLDTLVERERAFGKSVGEEVDSVHHQERTRAILKSVAAGSQGRLDALRELVSRRPAPRGQGTG
jgi:hypothetical protein